MWYNNETISEEEGVSKLLVGKTFAYFPQHNEENDSGEIKKDENNKNHCDSVENEVNIDSIDSITYNNTQYAIVTERLGRTIIPLNPRLLAESTYDQENIDSYLNEIHETVNKYSIITEYSLLLKDIPKNFYCLPQADNLSTWDLFIIIYSSYYKYGKFKLQICLDEEYPRVVPQVFFLTPIFHPLVNPKTGKLNLGKQLNNWNPSSHYMSLIFLYIKQMFYIQNEYPEEDVENEEAHFLFNNDKEAFLQKVKNCVEESNNTLYNNVNNFMFNFEQNIERKEILEKMKNISKEQNCSKKTEAFIFWFLNEYLNDIAVDSDEAKNCKDINYFGEHTDVPLADYYCNELKSEKKMTDSNTNTELENWPVHNEANYKTKEMSIEETDKI